MVMRTEAPDGRGCHAEHRRLRRLWGAVVATFCTLGCGVSPPPYSSPMAGNYCTDFLDFAHLCALWSTIGFLICMCMAVAAGFLAAQLNNDQAKESFFRKNQSTFLFVLAVLAGIFAAYSHSRADAASSAAAEVEVAMMTRDSGKMYNQCLGAASRWDGSLAKALDAANSAVPKTDSSGTIQLADAVEKSGDVRVRIIHATESQEQVLTTLLDAMEKSIPPGKMSAQLKDDLASARTKLDEVRRSLGDTKSISNDTSDLVTKAKKTLRASDEEQATAPAQPKTTADHGTSPQGR